MYTYRERLEQEEAELSGRISKLGSFLRKETNITVSKIEEDLLFIQYETMLTYQRILLTRIEYLEKAVSSPSKENNN